MPKSIPASTAWRPPGKERPQKPTASGGQNGNASVRPLVARVQTLTTQQKRTINSPRKNTRENTHTMKSGCCFYLLSATAFPRGYRPCSLCAAGCCRDGCAISAAVWPLWRSPPTHSRKVKRRPGIAQSHIFQLTANQGDATCFTQAPGNFARAIPTLRWSTEVMAGWRGDVTVPKGVGQCCSQWGHGRYEMTYTL